MQNIELTPKLNSNRKEPRPYSRGGSTPKPNDKGKRQDRVKSKPKMQRKNKPMQKHAQNLRQNIEIEPK